MATVRKRKWTHNGKEAEAWVVSYTDQTGKRRQKSFPKKKEADAFRVQVENEVATRVHVPASLTETLAAAVRAWLDDCEAKWKRGDMAGNTFQGYRSKVKQLPEGLMSKRLTDVTSVEIEAWANEALQRYSKRSVVMFVSIINMAMRLAVRRRKLAVNPLVHDPVAIGMGERRKPKIPTRSQLGQLLKSLTPGGSQPYRNGPRGQSPAIRAAIVSLGVFQGLRRGEIAGLQWEDVDFVADVLHVHHSYSRIDKLKAPKTRAGRRNVPLAKPTRAVLSHLWDAAERPKTGFVLLGRRGLPFDPNKLTSFHWPEIMSAAGLVDDEGKPLFSMHAMRHAYASLLIAQGLSPLLVSRQIGHSKTSVTLDVYSHLFAEDDTGARAVANISDSFSDATTPGLARFADAAMTRQIASNS